MRAIKFRCWYPKERKMLYVQTDIDRKGTKVMQFTGLRDKNKKDIYEGDIIKINDSVRRTHKKYSQIGKLIVVWNKESTGFEGKVIGKINYIDKSECLGNFRFKEYNLEVVGNIYENKEEMGK